MTLRELQRSVRAMAAKVHASQRARDSGFGDQLDAYFSANRKAWKTRREDRGARNPAQLADRLSARGEHASPNTVRGWADRKTLPEARYVGLLEEFLGAPWVYLDNPKNPAVKAEDRVIFLSMYARDPETREFAAYTLKKAAERRERL